MGRLGGEEGLVGRVFLVLWMEEVCFFLICGD